MLPAALLPRHLLLRLTLLLALMASAAVPAAAQQAGDAPADARASATIDVKDLQALVETLENEADRQAFLDNLRALVAAGSEVGETQVSHNLVERISERLSRVDEQIAALAVELDDGSQMAAWLEAQVSDPERRGLWLRTGLHLALVIAAAAAGWFLVSALLRPQLRRYERLRHGGWAPRALLALGQTLLTLAPVAAFAGLAYLAMALSDPDANTRAIAVAIVNAFVAVRAIQVLAGTVFAPLAPERRLLPMSDEQAAYFFVWTWRFAAVGAYGYFLVDLLGALGMPDSSVALLFRVVGLALAAMALIVVLQSREPVAQWILTHPETGTALLLRHRLADVWHVLASIAVIAVFVVWALDLDGGFVFLARGFAVTAAAVFGALLASTVLRRLLHRLFRLSDEFHERFPNLDRRANRYLALVSWILNAIVWLLATFVILEAWGIGVFDLFATPEGAQVVARALAIALIVTVAIIVWEIGDGMISRALAAGDVHPLSPRLKTLLPLARNALLVGLSAIAAITILAEIGVDIAPLLAGAGVVGLAIGFGAQTLVKDIITGGFMVFEDQFSVGDWIDAGGKSGAVEAITIRTIRLRDLDGYVHTVPFGEITTLTNMMRDFGYAVVDVGVAYKENTDQVVEVLREVDAEARLDPAFAERLAGDLEVLGVNALGDSAVTLRIRVRTVAGFQWGVRREYLRRIKLKFDEVGIEIPFPHMTVWFGEMKGGTLPPVAHVRIDAAPSAGRVPDDGDAVTAEGRA